MRPTIDLLKGDAPVRLYKEFLPDVKAIEGESRQFRFLITTSGVDRDRDVLSASGWRLEPYRKNPVVLWAHCYDQPPVAIARTIEVSDGALASVAEFVDPAVYPFAGVVAELVRIGALRAASVGFRPIKWSYNEERRGVDFEEQELLEWSVVPVPANADCLVEARSAGVDIEPLREWAAKTLERLGGPKPVDVEALAEAVAAKIGARPALVSVPAESKSMGSMADQCMADMDVARDAVTRARTRLESMRDEMDEDEHDDDPMVMETLAGLELHEDELGKKLVEDATALIKRGRVLSRANEGKLRQASERITEASESISAVLATVAEQAEEASAAPGLDVPAPSGGSDEGRDPAPVGKASGAADDDELDLDDDELDLDDEEDDDLKGVSPEDVRAAMKEAIVASVRDTVAALRGRVD